MGKVLHLMLCVHSATAEDMQAFTERRVQLPKLYEKIMAAKLINPPRTKPSKVPTLTLYFEKMLLFILFLEKKNENFAM